MDIPEIPDWLVRLSAWIGIIFGLFTGFSNLSRLKDWVLKLFSWLRKQVRKLRFKRTEQSQYAKSEDINEQDIWDLVKFEVAQSMKQSPSITTITTGDIIYPTILRRIFGPELNYRDKMPIVIENAVDDVKIEKKVGDTGLVVLTLTAGEYICLTERRKQAFKDIARFKLSNVVRGYYDLEVESEATKSFRENQ